MTLVYLNLILKLGIVDHLSERVLLSVSHTVTLIGCGRWCPVNTLTWWCVDVLRGVAWRHHPRTCCQHQLWLRCEQNKRIVSKLSHIIDSSIKTYA